MCTVAFYMKKRHWRCAHLFSLLFVFVHRLGVPQCVPGLSRSDSVCCVAGGSLWRLRLVSTQAGEFTNTPRLSSCCCLAPTPLSMLSESQLKIKNTGNFSSQSVTRRGLFLIWIQKRAASNSGHDSLIPFSLISPNKSGVQHESVFLRRETAAAHMWRT